MELNKKRYRDLDTYYKIKYNKKIIKLPLDGGFTCPNRDGSLSFKGCIYCSDNGAGEWTYKSAGAIKNQIAFQKNKLSKPGREEAYIAYFQNFTNTHAPLHVLKARFEQVIHEEGVVGIMIATRPDCLSDDVVEYLAELNQKFYMWVELGI